MYFSLQIAASRGGCGSASTPPKNRFHPEVWFSFRFVFTTSLMQACCAPFFFFFKSEVLHFQQSASTKPDWSRGCRFAQYHRLGTRGLHSLARSGRTGNHADENVAITAQLSAAKTKKAGLFSIKSEVIAMLGATEAPHTGFSKGSWTRLISSVDTWLGLSLALSHVM